MTDSDDTALPGDRLAKVIARSGLCSRRDAEDWIKGGRVSVNGTLIRTPAFNVTDKDRIKVDGEPLVARKGTRVWLYHKPPGLVVTEKDPEGRPTIFDKLAAEGLPRVLTIGRLDINTEGLLLLTNDGGLKRVLELPATGWLRRYRVRAFGSITQAQLDVLKDGIEIEGVKYGPIEAILEREQGSNVWLVVALREGKNREVKNVLGVLGLVVNRLIRVSYGPFQLGDLPIGGIEVVKARVLREQLGKKLAEEAGVDFDSELPEPQAIAQARRATDPNQRAAAPGKEAPRQARGRRSLDAESLVPRRQAKEERPVRHRPGRPDMGPPPKKPKPEKPAGRPRRILFDDGREETFVPPARGKRDDKPEGKFGDRPPRREGGFESRGPRPPRRNDDRPRAPRGDRPERKSFGSRDGAPRAPRAFGDRPPRGPRPEGSARGPRPTGDRPPRSPRPAGDRPPRGPRPEGASRGPRPAGDRPARGPGGQSRGPRPGGPARGPRPAGGPARAPKPGGPRPPRKPRP
jgi:23S rRNA pseudouridine2605 synthase